MNRTRRRTTHYDRGHRCAKRRSWRGPALNDMIWLYGSKPEQIMAQIERPRLGVMPAWQGRLDDTSIKMLTVYVHSLGGGE